MKSMTSEWDCIILSHVLEHFLNPINELKEITRKIKVGGYILIQVPSLYSQHYNPILKFQNAHTIQFFDPGFLSSLLESLGFRVIYFELTPDLTIVGQKLDDINKTAKSVQFYKDKRDIIKIQHHLKRAYISFRFFQLRGRLYGQLQKYPISKRIMSKIYHMFNTTK